MKLLIQATAARMKGFDLSRHEGLLSVDHPPGDGAGRRDRRHPAARADDRPQLRVDSDGRRLSRPCSPTAARTGRCGPAARWCLPRRRPSAPSAPSIPGTTTFGDVASSFAGWAENTMGSMASAISPGSLSLPHPSRRISRPQRRRPRDRRVLPGPVRGRHQRRRRRWRWRLRLCLRRLRLCLRLRRRRTIISAREQLIEGWHVPERSEGRGVAVPHALRCSGRATQFPPALNIPLAVSP